MDHFDFGENWCSFVSRSLSVQHVKCAREDFSDLMSGIDVSNKTFLDIGYGQGLSLLCAVEQGANVVGLDVNSKSVDALRVTARFFPGVELEKVSIYSGSILSKQVVEKLLNLQPNGYDIVHAWGVLHHTGDMKQALKICSSLVMPGGYLVVSIYNRHWTSPIWRIIKYLYCRSPFFMKKAFVYTFLPLIWVAKLVVTRDNPRKKERGMDFFHDVVDWVGGYPYEYASIEEFISICGKENLLLLSSRHAVVPTGCNEFVVQKPVP